MVVAQAGLRGLGWRKGLLSHHSPEHRGRRGAGLLLPPVGLPAAGIKDRRMIWRRGLEESHEGMWTWEQLSEEGRALLGPGQGLPSGVPNPLDPGAGSQEGHLRVTDCQVFPDAHVDEPTRPPCRPVVREPWGGGPGPEPGRPPGPGHAGWKRTTRLGFLCFRLSILRPGLGLGSRKQPRERKEAAGHPVRVCRGGLSAAGRGREARIRV